jgi:hypothetical protein
VAAKAFRYKRIFAYGSLQFCGHIEEYLAANTDDLMIFIVQPRVGAKKNTLRRYHEGIVVEERAVRSSPNIFLYYLLWYVIHVRETWRFGSGGMKTLIMGGHPLVFFGMSFFRRLRPFVYAYWIGDYFPSSHPMIRLFERIKKRYHDRVDYAYYLSDAINKMMNGVVVQTSCRRTVMWGLKPFPVSPVPPLFPFSLLFVGLIRSGQGLEKVFDFLVNHHDCRLTVIGVCQPAYYAELNRLLEQNGLKNRVFYPNRFYSEQELLDVARHSHVGMALYDTGPANFTHYADPGKIKAYAEMHLPVLMTRISDIVPFIEQFGSGEVIDKIDDLGEALERIRNNYPRYQQGVERFVAYFDYEGYYRSAFRSWEGE